ncbi:MAG: hypothetical protein M0035_09130 [Actinomycetota bacterium]|nr:hypothetical protein [Actinomycetota bacterium]
MPRLPQRPNLDQLRHQARDLLDAAKGGNPDALRRLHAASAELTLTGAQLTIARECGYSSWPALKKAVQEHNTRGSAAASTSQDAGSDVPDGGAGLTAAGDLEIFQGDDAVRVRLPFPEDPLTPSLHDWMGEYRQLAKQRGIDAFVEEIPGKVVLEVRLGLELSNDETLRKLKEARVLVREAKRAAAARFSRDEAKEELIRGWWRRSTAPMHAVGYAGIAFTPTGKAAVLLESGEWLSMTAAQAENLVRHREEEGLPPIPVIDPPVALPTRALRKRPGPRRHPRIELPPSVITDPLVLWQNPGGGSLTCERVIAYPNGFEIELRASGLLAEDVTMPWGRSSRGFWHFQGLQLTVAFADGRNRHIEDLTSGDEEGELTVSPFRRDDSDLETLWLWVMPSPGDGHVRLVATWTLHGIQQAAVEFELTSSQSGEAAP